MNKNPTWKFLLIVGLVAAAAWLVYPPQDKLQGGLDLVGGTSLVYEIDTTGLDPDERKDLAQNMIPNLRKRVDPKGGYLHVAAGGHANRNTTASLKHRNR